MPDELFCMKRLMVLASIQFENEHPFVQLSTDWRLIMQCDMFVDQSPMFCFVPLPTFKGPIVWMGICLSFLNHSTRSKWLWMCPEQIYKMSLNSRTSQTLDWLLFCYECLNVRWPAGLPYVLIWKIIFFKNWQMNVYVYCSTGAASTHVCQIII
jgi:hypothetical protein